MRIPSQLDQDGLYPMPGRRFAAPGGRPGGGQSWRKVIRLAIALALVLVVMGRAADPKYYRVFFPETPQKVAFAASDQPAIRPGSPQQSSFSDAVDEAMAGQGGVAEAEMAKPELADSRSNPGAEADEPGLGSSKGAGDVSDEELAQMLERVIDGATWRGEDNDAFRALRAIADRASTEDAAEIGVLPLLQQPDLYRGSKVRIRGRAVRCDVVEDYFQVWIKPADGTNRPALAIVNQVPDSLRKLSGGTYTNGPELEVIGRFLKRLAYRSGKGADVVPVVIGRIDQIERSAVSDALSIPDVSTPISAGTWIWFAAASAAGVLLAVGIFWHSQRQSRRIRKQRQSGRDSTLHLSVWVLFLSLVATSENVLADSALELISGFDAARMENVFPVDGDGEAVAEMAKLVYRLDRLDPTSLASRANAASLDHELGLGDASAFRGNVDQIQSIPVPADLRSYLEFPRLYQLIIRPTESPKEAWVVISSGVPPDLQTGDIVWGVGVSVLGSAVDDMVVPIRRALATGGLSWQPQEIRSVGWRLLADQGFDLGLLDDIRRANRKPLRAEDQRSFYAMMDASRYVTGDTPIPKRVPIVDLLTRPERLAGDYVRIDAELVRVTRVQVAPARQASGEVSATSYYQLDAMGNVGDVEIQIEAPDSGGPPLRLKNRFPVSIVVNRLPEFLEAAMTGDPVTVAVRRPVVVDGFYYRLWSYESDLSQRAQGSSNQLSPLIIATSIDARLVPEGDPIGVGRIGWLVTGAILLGAVAILVWNLTNRRRDRFAGLSRPEPEFDLNRLKPDDQQR
ncbi:hypothetical protein [Crateriforma conspicua]|uniref:hypothetical protein n=1 Tax=Crateriforma conspicua TaxID=2527996 RepID=UPI0011881CF3|nr:hypothetical protein [Crateriforma conspicua]QDV65267.1 hypothetical protein Mal65_44370 [Crateriforma conspicua]